MKLSLKLKVSSTLNSHREKQREIKKAAARAINRAIDTGRTVGGRAVAKATRIPVRQVRSRMSVRGATPSLLVAEIEAHPYSPNLAKFNARENAQGVAATAWEKRKTYKGAFIHPRTQKVVSRTSKSRTPLKGLRGPSVPRTFERSDVIEQIDRAARDRFESEFEREIARRLT